MSTLAEQARAVVDSRLDRAVEAMRAADACGGDAGGTVPHRGRALAHADVCSACAGLAALAVLRVVLAEPSEGARRAGYNAGVTTRTGSPPMSTLKITDARAKELEALCDAATWSVDLSTLDAEAAFIGAAKSALPDLLTDRRTLLDELRRAERLIADDPRRDKHADVLADLRALLASAEGGSDAR